MLGFSLLRRRLTLAPPCSPIRDFHPLSPSPLAVGSGFSSPDSILGLLRHKNYSFLEAQDSGQSPTPTNSFSSSPVCSPPTASGSYADMVRRTPPPSPRCDIQKDQRKDKSVNLKDSIERVRYIRRIQKEKGCCFRCGERRHKIADCPNAKVCGHCKAVGHLVNRCPSLFPRSKTSSTSSSTSISSSPSSTHTSLPPPLLPSKTPMAQRTLGQLRESEQTKLIEKELAVSVVVQGTISTSISEVMAGIKQYIPFGVPWNVRLLPLYRFQIEGTEELKARMEKEGGILIGSKWFPRLKDKKEVKDLDPRAGTYTGSESVELHMVGTHGQLFKFWLSLAI